MRSIRVGADRAHSIWIRRLENEGASDQMTVLMQGIERKSQPASYST